VIGVLINHNLVRVPEPIIAKAVVVWGNAKVETAKPKTLPASPGKAEDMVGAEPAREVPMLPRMIEMVVRIIAAGVMPDPLAVGMDVRGVWMSGLVAIIAVLCRGLLLSSSRSRTMSRNVSGVNSMAATTAFVLRKRCQRKYQQRHKKSDTFFHGHLRELLPRIFILKPSSMEVYTQPPSQALFFILSVHEQFRATPKGASSAHSRQREGETHV